MNDLFEWPILIILVADSLGLLMTILLTWRLYLPILFLLIMFAVFGGAIALNVIYPGGWWSSIIGYITSAVALLLLVGYVIAINDENNEVRGRLSSKDQAVVDDFYKWAGGGNVGQKKQTSGFGSYASRDRDVDRSASQSGDPVCSNCGTVYNREVVISLLKQQSPEIFAFQTWTTKFVCKQCRAEIVISGSQEP